MLVDEGQRDAYVAAHRDLVERARAFEGCIDLAITADPVDPRRVNNLEVWASAEVLDAWRAEANTRRHASAALQRRRRWPALLGRAVELAVLPTRATGASRPSHPAADLVAGGAGQEPAYELFHELLVPAVSDWLATHRSR